MDDAQKARFWLAVAAVTILNFGIWMFVGTPSGGPTDVRITYSTNAIQFEYSGRLEIRFDRNVFEPEGAINTSPKGGRTPHRFPPFL